MTLKWPWFVLRQGQIWLVRLWEKVKTVDFSETIATCDLKVGRCRQLIEIMKVFEYWRSRSFLYYIFSRFCMFCDLLGQDIGWAFTGPLVLWFCIMQQRCTSRLLWLNSPEFVSDLVGNPMMRLIWYVLLLEVCYRVVSFDCIYIVILGDNYWISCWWLGRFILKK